MAAVPDPPVPSHLERGFTPDSPTWPIDVRAYLRCRRPNCPCRLPGAPLHCPACESLKPTLTIDGRAIRCASGCTQEDIQDALRARGLLPTPAPHSPPRLPAHLGFTPLSGIVPRPVRWLWPGYIPFAKVTLLLGGPKGEASIIAADLAARVTSGAHPPTGGPQVPQVPAISPSKGPVVYVSTALGVADVLLPRLDAFGADPNMLFAFAYVTGPKGILRPPSIDRDAHHIESVIRDTRARMLVVDSIDALTRGPVTAYRAMTALHFIAERTGVAVLCVGHLPTGSAVRALRLARRRPTAAASVLVTAFAGLDGAERSALVPAVTPLAPDAMTVPFTLRQHPIAVLWDAPVHTDIFIEPGSLRPTDQLGRAADLLLLLLDDGPLPAQRIKEAARAQGIAPWPLHRARLLTNTKSVRVSTPGGTKGQGAWYWHLPFQGFEWTEDEKTSTDLDP